HTRGVQLLKPRDNVVFESGLFLGKHGRKRTFFVTPRATPHFKLPSDFDGVTTADYDPSKLSRNVKPGAVVEPACNKIREAINEHLAAPPSLRVFAEFRNRETGGNYPLKVYLNIHNITSLDVLLSSASLTPGQDLTLSDKMDTLPSGQIRLQFRT